MCNSDPNEAAKMMFRAGNIKPNGYATADEWLSGRAATPTQAAPQQQGSAPRLADSASPSRSVAPTSSSEPTSSLSIPTAPRTPGGIGLYIPE